jgi:hypothetical protein
MKTLELEVYEIFKTRLGEKDAAKVIEFIEEKSDKVIQTKTGEFASKGDVANAKTDIIKWMFIFWIGQVAVTIGLVSILLK